MRKTKTAQYRKLLEQLKRLIDRGGNMEQVLYGNCMELNIADGRAVHDILVAFEEIKCAKK